MDATWSTYKTKPATTALYTDDATVIYVPSGAGARGSAQIRRFYLQPDFKATTVHEQVHHTVKQGSKLIEEADWTVTFGDGTECAWLVPTLDEGVLSNCTVKVPVVISATFEGDLISVLRVLWDQASVLKQLRVITDRQKWPVRGGEEVDALRNPSLVQLNPFAPNDALASPTPAPTSKKTLAIDAPGRIFGPIRPEDQVSHSVRRNLHEPARNIFAYEPPAPKPLVAHNPSRLDSSFSFGHAESTGNNNNNNNNPASRRASPKETQNLLSHQEMDGLTQQTAGMTLSNSASNRQQQRPR
ncbi:hypothetical protein BDB00DRAFT_909343 [Zychaea mexicana]|uniref:uncharacterized protein n=1 Tax=Zychaea mexicana TaxID=64656 RepID=UPI0022FF209D|nr:uncharacterized protein BDB00DRAFT_909343 [Zychaea mexicana]KAI9492842.1 hypothetical protein BDB00DRAFT_909343 [Zychaea mexicana]